ncbi:diguanylate cyclase [Legionella sainthelensi]|nr:diguanylate cyclase [Legionella sainthelensi]
MRYFPEKNVRKYDVVVRLGGDEFAILFDDLSEKADAVKIAEKIIPNLNLDPFFNSNELKVSTSIGISFYRGNHSTRTN